MSIQAFSNGTVLLSVEVTIGAREIVPLPVTFHGYVCKSSLGARTGCGLSWAVSLRAELSREHGSA